MDIEQSTAVRKITISLPEYLVEFADQHAIQSRTSRSQVISSALAMIKKLEEEKLAAEGYQFYANEAIEFAAASGQAASEAWGSMEEYWDAS